MILARIGDMDDGSDHITSLDNVAVRYHRDACDLAPIGAIAKEESSADSPAICGSAFEAERRKQVVRRLRHEIYREGRHRFACGIGLSAMGS